MNDNRKRNRQFAIRITDDELALFNIKQSLAKLSKTDFFVGMVNDTKIISYQFTEQVHEIYHELRKLGVNLNQIATHANSGYFPQAESEIKDIFPLYESVMTALKSFLEKPLINAKFTDVGLAVK
jgi:ATP-dependent helicase/DNAse subunit B